MRLKLRRVRNKLKKPKRRLLTKIPPVPTMVTLGNGVCGFAAMILSLRALSLGVPPVPVEWSGWTPERCLYWAGLLIFLAMVFDVLDGRVARFTRTAGRFGAEMDSLCDMVSFGVAPALLVYAEVSLVRQGGGGYPVPDRYVWLLLATYVCCAALRLARFNIEISDDHPDFFFGLPSPAAAGCVVGWVVLIHGGNELPPLLQPHFSLVIKYLPLVLPFFAFLLGVLMITRVRYVHIGEKLLRGRRSFIYLLGLLLTFVLVAMQAEIMLVLSFNGYLLFGLLRVLRRRGAVGEPRGVSPASATEVAAAGEPLSASAKPAEAASVPESAAAGASPGGGKQGAAADETVL